MNILQVSTRDIDGGAEKIGWTLYHAYRKRGHNSWLSVGYKRSRDPDILLIPNDAYHHIWAKFCTKIGNRLSSLSGRIRGADRIGNLLKYQAARPLRWVQVRLGHEDFNFPASSHLLELAPQSPDVLHCHNLHGNYFDLRAIPWLSRKIPVILTLHDAWLLGGHCAHSPDCDRWKTGCGECPGLNFYPAVRRDATAYNWRRKKALYKKSRLFITTPSGWLMKKVEQSVLASAVAGTRVIPNGIDLSVFRPADKQAVRAELGIPAHARVLLFTANGIRQNPWKDYLTLKAAVARVAENQENHHVLFIALGESAQAEQLGRARIEFVPYQNDPSDVARYYQAADVYVHAAKAETFPNTVLEAIACGTPVVATAVGGIPEQIQDGKTGLLVLSGDAEAMARSVRKLLEDENLRQYMGFQAAESARRFGLERMTDDYLKWYQEILQSYRLPDKVS